MGTSRLAWRLSPQLYAWRLKGGTAGDARLPAALDQGCADAFHGGYDGVEFSLSWLRHPGRAAAIVDLLDSYQLGLAALFTTVPDGASAPALAAVADLAGSARVTRCRLLNVATVPADGAAGQHDGLTATARVLDTLASLVADHGVGLCWHPHEEHLRDDGAGLRRVLTATNPQTVAVCLDLGWVARSGADCVSLLAACGPRLRMLHLRDLRNGIWSQALGEGDLDLAAIGAQLDRSGFDGWTTVELWFDRATEVTRSVPDNARVSLEVLRRLTPWRRR